MVTKKTTFVLEKMLPLKVGKLEKFGNSVYFIVFVIAVCRIFCNTQWDITVKIPELQTVKTKKV